MNQPAASPEVRHSGKPFVFAWIFVILLGFGAVALVRSHIVSIEGVYDAELCVGKSPDSRCIKGLAHLKAGKIAGEGENAVGKFTLEGDLEPSGRALFHARVTMPGENGDAHLTGNLKDGHLPAEGAFGDGVAAHLALDKAGA